MLIFNGNRDVLTRALTLSQELRAAGTPRGSVPGFGFTLRGGQDLDANQYPGKHVLSTPPPPPRPPTSPSPSVYFSLVVIKIQILPPTCIPPRSSSSAFLSSPVSLLSTPWLLSAKVISWRSEEGRGGRGLWGQGGLRRTSASVAAGASILQGFLRRSGETEREHETENQCRRSDAFSTCWASASIPPQTQATISPIGPTGLIILSASFYLYKKNSFSVLTDCVRKLTPRLKFCFVFSPSGRKSKRGDAGSAEPLFYGLIFSLISSRFTLSFTLAARCSR